MMLGIMGSIGSRAFSFCCECSHLGITVGCAGTIGQMEFPTFYLASDDTTRYDDGF